MNEEAHHRKEVASGLKGHAPDNAAMATEDGRVVVPVQLAAGYFAANVSLPGGVRKAIERRAERRPCYVIFIFGRRLAEMVSA